MRARLFALTLALGALLCAAPSAAALDAQPEAVPDAPAVETQADENAAPLPDELAPAGVSEEVPILPEKPPTIISSTTPEEIGFIWEEVHEEETLAEEEATLVRDRDEPGAASPADPTETAPTETVSDDTAGTASTTPAVPTLPQTGIRSGLVRALFSAGFALLTGGWLLGRKASVSTH